MSNESVKPFQSNRIEDSRLEKIVNEFLDKYFFQNPKYNVTDVEWITDKEQQLKGIDVIFSLKDKGLEKIKVDIKAAVKYTHRYLSTYALECSSLDRNGKEKEGWLTDSKKETEYYLLAYPRGPKYYTDIQTIDDIDTIEFYLVERKKIQEFLAQNNFDNEKIAEIVKEMREEYKEGNGLAKNPPVGNFFFYLTGTLAEKPINVVIKRYVYKELCVLHKTITKK